MSDGRPSDEEVNAVVEHAPTSRHACAQLAAEVLRARRAEEKRNEELNHMIDLRNALEAKLREAEEKLRQEKLLHQGAAENWRSVCADLEKAERERDEARKRLEQASRHIHDTTHERMVTWEHCRHWSCPEDRAALGKKP